MIGEPQMRGHAPCLMDWVRNADALHGEFSGSGADVIGEPEDQPYGMREFKVRDPDGHVLAFGHDTTGAI